MTRFETVVIIIGISVCLSLTAGVAGADRSANETQAPPLPETVDNQLVTTASTTTDTDTRHYVLTAPNATAIDTDALSQYGTLGVQTGSHIELRTTPDNRTVVEALEWVDSIRPAVAPQRSQTPGAGDGQSLGVEDLHTAGTTASDVTVGIIDFGFDATAPPIRDQVVETRSFTMTKRDPAHGTAVAEIVARTAPDSNLHLVSAANSVQSKRAIEYLTRQNVDIIVASWGNPVYEDDGDHFFTTPVNEADAAGVLFVTAAGNHAETHWEGMFQDADGDGVHEWTASGDERNCLPDCTTDYTGALDITLRWEDTGQPSEYGLGVYDRAQGEYVGTATTVEQTETNKYVRLTGNIVRQPIDLVVENTGGVADDDVEVIVNGPVGMQRTVAESSITAPADVPAAFSVAAYEPGESRIAPYSSRGPTDDGRHGIDITGYTNIEVTNGLYDETPYVFAGTSAAAPYVGGVAALVTADSGAPPTDEVATTLRMSSDDIKRSGADPISGAGVINATAAIAPDGGDGPDSTTTAAATTIGGSADNALYQGDDGTAYQGQDIFVVGDNITTDVNNYALRQVDSFDGGTVDGSSQIEALQTFEVGEDDGEIPAYVDEDELSDGEAFLVLETDDLDQDDYFVRGGELPVNPDEGSGTFEVVIQDLLIAFDDNDTPVTDEGDDAVAELEIDSNRVNYNANISADGDLDEEELVDIFVTTENVESDEGTITDAGDVADGQEIDDIRADVLELRDEVRTDGDDNLVIEDSTATGSETGLSVDDLLETEANPFNALVYASGEQGADEKFALVDITNPEEDVSFAGIDDGEYTVTLAGDDTTAAASATVLVDRSVGTVDYTNRDGIVDTGGLVGAVADWRSDAIETGTLLDVIQAWRSGSPVV